MPAKPYKDPDYQPFAALLKKSRRVVDMTQEDLAKRVGLQTSAICAIERGNRRVDVVEFHRIAQAIGACPVDLFSRASREILVGPLTKADEASGPAEKGPSMDRAAPVAFLSSGDDCA